MSPRGRTRRRVDLRQLERYVDACKRLLADLDAVRADLEFQDRGGHLHVAVDFSEIYAFARPGDGARDMVHFDTEREVELGLAIEASALESLFFGRFGDVVLLAPYRIELHNFLRRLEASHLERTADHLLEILGEVRELLGRPETREIDALQAKLAAGDALDDAEIDRAIDYFGRHAPALVLFATRGPGKPGARLRHLLGKGRLATLEQLESFGAGGVPEAPEAEIREIFEHLEDVRPKPSGANYLDAAALAQVRAVNRRLRDQNARLLLVSRSQSLAATRDDLGLDDVPLRHPRTWSAFFRPLPEDSEQVIDDALDAVAERRRALGLFIESAEEHLKAARRRGQTDPAPADSERARALIDRLESLVDEWLLGQRVLMSGHLDPDEGRRGQERHVTRLLEMVADDSRLFEEVRGRLEHLTRDHQELGWELQSGSTRSREIIDQSLVLEGFEGKTVFSPSTADSIQYTLQFTSTALRGALRGFHDRWQVRFDELRALFVEGLSDDDAYERLLAMAYTLGLLGRWPLAERYARAALDEAAEGADGPSPHEGHFFLAVCQRKFQRSRRRLDAGLAHLDIASRLKRERAGDPAYEDPRYLKERATLLQVERSLLRYARKPETPEAKKRAVEQIEQLLHAAIERAESDRYLLAQSYNGLCYLYLTEGPAYRESMRRYAERLEAELDDLLTSPAAWPANCIDTLCYARFIDRGETASRAELQAWAEQLDELTDESRRPLVPREDRQRVERHAQLIRRALERR